jgi:hypothetical protein
VNTFDAWEKVPSEYRTKTSLTRLGYDPVDFGPVVAEIAVYGKRYSLYSYETASTNALKAGRKTVINTKTKKQSILMDINVTGWESHDEVMELMLMNFDGQVLFHKRFRPKTPLSAKNKIFLGNPNLEMEKPISEYWDEIQTHINGKSIIIPNKYNVFKMLAQTCQKYNLHLTCEATVLDDNKRLQRCFVTPVSLPDGKSDPSLQKNCIAFISCLYPTSKLFGYQSKAKYYFNTLCNYNFRVKGEVNAYSNGYNWIKNSFGEDSRDFEDYSLNTCSQIINGLQNVLETFRLI